MSRQIDLSDPSKLNEDDLRHAAQHNLLTSQQLAECGIIDIQAFIAGESGELLDADVDRMVLTDPDEIELIREHRSGSVPTIRRVGLEEVEQTDGERQAELDEAARQKASKVEQVDYEDWTNDQLIVECTERKPPLDIGGRKKELIERLRADDERLVAKAQAGDKKE